MITKKDIVAIVNGEVEWYMVTADAHACAVAKAINECDGDYELVRSTNRDWVGFRNSLSMPAQRDAIKAFINSSAWDM